MKIRQVGFTLIEVMVTVAIIGILSAIAIPAYTDYILRGRITESVASLSDMRVKMEQFFQDYRTYDGACTAGTVAPLPPDTPQFAFTCPVKNATTYTVQADGRGSMAGFIFTIDRDNVRKTTGAPTGWTRSDTCWVMKKDGSC